MAREAWYLGCRSDEVAERVVLIGNPARVERIAPYLDDVHRVTERRGLKTITGRYDGVAITVSAFGMGAPIATVVMHELFDLGSRAFLRVGTAIALEPAAPGEFLIAASALRREGTSAAYAPPALEPVADAALADALETAVAGTGAAHRAGKFASFDGFYRDMFALDPETAARVAKNYRALRELDVIAVDMETSALLTAAQVLGAAAGSFCLATVDGATQEKLDRERVRAAEATLFIAALGALAAIPVARGPVSPAEGSAARNLAEQNPARQNPAGQKPAEQSPAERNPVGESSPEPDSSPRDAAGRNTTPGEAIGRSAPGRRL